MRDVPRTQFGIALLLGVALAAPALAGPPALQVDQQQPAIDAGEVTLAIGGPDRGQKLAQTFTVGLDGRLAGVGLPIGCADGRLDLQIQGVTATGEPDGVALVERSYAATTLPEIVPATFVELSLPRRLRVAVGDTLALVLANESGTCGVASSPDGDSYPGGRAWFDSPPNDPGWIPNAPLRPEDDLPFQTIVFAPTP